MQNNLKVLVLEIEASILSNFHYSKSSIIIYNYYETMKLKLNCSSRKSQFWFYKNLKFRIWVQYDLK